MIFPHAGGMWLHGNSLQFLQFCGILLDKVTSSIYSDESLQYVWDVIRKEEERRNGPSFVLLLCISSGHYLFYNVTLRKSKIFNLLVREIRPQRHLI